MSKVSENKIIFVYKFSVSIFQQYMYYSYVVTLTIKKKKITPNMQQITSKMKAEKASTFNLKETHINTRLSHSFPICPKKWKLQKCLL